MKKRMKTWVLLHADEHEVISMYEALFNERKALEYEMHQERLEGRN